MTKRNLLGALVLAAVAGVLLWRGGALGALGGGGSSHDEGPNEAGPEAAVAGMEDDAARAADPAAGGQLASRLRPERRGVGRITARVVRVGTEKPVAGAVITVHGTGYAGEEAVAKVETDAQGMAAIESVAAGDAYEVRVAITGEAGLTIPDVEVRASRTKDLGTIIVGARSVLVGRVVDERGAALPGADVRAFVGYENLLEIMGNMMELFSSLGREPTPLSKATSDADGKFRLADLPPGNLHVRATLAGRRQAVAKVRMTPEGPIGGAPTLRLEPGATVSGVIVETGGAPVAGATIAMLDSGKGGGEDPMSFMTGRVFATTDAKGVFKATVAENAHGLRGIVEAAGFPTTVTGEFAADVKDLRIVLARGAEIQLTLVQADGGAPILGAQILAMVAEKKGFSDPDTSGGLVYGVTDAAGTVTLPSRPGFIEMLMVSHERFGSGMARSGSKGGGSRSDMGGLEGDVPEEVKAGEPTKVSLRMKKALVLTGRVVGPGQAPIAGAEVRTFSFGGGGGGSGTARSGEDGTYRLEGLTDMGNGLLMAKAPGFAREMAQLEVDDASRNAGELHHDFVLRPGSTIRGMVRDGAGQPVSGVEVSMGVGRGIGQLLGSGGTVTGPDGSYVLKDVDTRDEMMVFRRPPDDEGKEKGPKSVRVQAKAEGYVSASSEPFVVPEGQEVEAPPIRLSRGATLVGTVREPGGRAAGGATLELMVDPERDLKVGEEEIRVLDGVSNAPRTLRADAEGKFEAATVPKGTATLTVKASGFAESRKTVKVTAETETSPIEVLLRPGLELKGRVTDAEGRPLAGAQVRTGASIDGLEGDEAYAAPVTVKTEADGTFKMKDRPPGSVDLTILAERHQPYRTKVAAGGAAVEARLEARKAADPDRVAQIQKELQEVYQQFSKAKSAAEKETLQRRMTELYEEQQELQPPTDAPTPARAGDR